MSKYKKFVQGIYRPLNPSKCKGTAVYRSSYELKAFRYLDKNPNVVFWSSERVVLPYTSPLDGRVHRYFVDIVVHMKKSDGTIRKLLVEVKPHNQTIPPKQTPRKRLKTFMVEQRVYAQNAAKWSAATQWANKNGYQFIILTEKHLN